MIAVKISERVEPHCIVWAHAMAGLWGISRKHDLDEPVPLSQAVPVRLRYAEGAEDHHGSHADAENYSGGQACGASLRV